MILVSCLIHQQDDEIQGKIMTNFFLQDHVARKAAELLQEMPNLRRGQALFLALEAIDQDHAEIVRGTEADCFYDDQKIQSFWESMF